MQTAVQTMSNKSTFVFLMACIVIPIVREVTAEIKTQTTMHVPLLDDILIHDALGQDIPGIRSLVKCLMHCNRRPTCKIVGYLQSTGNCRVYNSLSLTSSNGSQWNGWVHYANDDPNCPVTEGFYRDPTSQICMHDGQTSLMRDAAVTYCASKNAKIIEVYSSERLTAFNDFVTSRFPTANVRIALYKDSGSWMWSSGIPFSSGIDNWDSENSQPACSTSNCDCAIAVRHNGFKWHDVTCDTMSKVVCERI